MFKLCRTLERHFLLQLMVMACRLLLRSSAIPGKASRHYLLPSLLLLHPVTRELQ